MGGWSIGFHRAGFQCIGIDTVDVGYPYELLQRDIRELDGNDILRHCFLRGYAKNYERCVTAVVASPPCVEYSKITMLSYRKGQRGPPDPEKGNVLVRATKRVIDEIQPKYWVVENVFGARKHIDPILGRPCLVSNPYVLWGNIPPTMFRFEPRRVSKEFHHGPWNWADKTSGAGKDPATSKWVIGKNFSQLNDWKKGKGGTRRGLPEDFPFDPLRSWKRARIPVFLSHSIATAIKAAVTNSTVE
jgi:hypothetical protein